MRWERSVCLCTQVVVITVALFLTGCDRGALFLPDGLNRLMIRQYVDENGYYSEQYPPERTCVAPERPLCFCDGTSLQTVVAGLRLEDRVELNTAPVERLVELPGVGPHTAAQIIASRPFETVDDLLEVRGIGPGKMYRLLPLVRVDTP